MRAKELDTLIGLVRARKSVRLVGDLELGKTSLLQELETSLTALGFAVMRVRATPALSSVKYAALRQSGVQADRLHPQSTPDEIQDALSVELARSTNSVILVDDAEWLDLASAQALAPLVHRDTVTGVFASAPFKQLTTEQRMISRLLRADARVELRPLSFEQVGVLAESLLGAPISPEMASEIFSMSSGVTGVAADILRAAGDSSSFQTDGQGWSSARSEFWSEHLEETVERLVASLPDSAFRLLHALALAGNLPAEGVHAHDPDTAVTLTQSGLVTAFRDPHGELRLSPRPALITDYFRQRPVDVLHLSALTLLRRLASPLPEQPYPSVMPATPHLPLAVHSDSHDAHNAGLARFIREDAEQRLIAASRDWRRLSNPPHAIAYLDALMQAGGYPGTAAEVLTRTPPTSENAVELLQLALHEQMLGEQPPPWEPRHATALRAQHADFTPALNAYAMYLLFAQEGLTAEVSAWLAEPGTDPVGFSETVADYIRAATGHIFPPSEAQDPPAPIPLQRALADQTHLITVVRHSALDDTLEGMLADPISLLPGDDPMPFLVDSYVRSQILLGLGRLPEARETLSQALSVGDLDLRFAVLYAAMLRWSALLHFRDGRTDIARSLLNESKRYSSLRGTMPGMRPEFGEALEVLFSGDRLGASKRFLSDGRECFKRSLIDTAWSMARFAFQLDPGEEALGVLDRFSRHPSYAWSRRISRFARAALNQDPNLVFYVSQLSSAPELSTAADFLADIERAQVTRGVPGNTAYAKAVAEAKQAFIMFREPLARSSFADRAPAVETLTPRELEIAPLTATLSNREIAERLTLSIRTVENHIARSMKKLGLSSRKDLSAALSSVAIASSGSSAES
ncbi:regulatory LuxR family protein [Leucobacter komagatae]|uniref:Regulatory LuxR family protein n=1 Tax=Leucobacter komagatae TaxID=55969 RepID=A0A542Y5X9_9MICO|nr:LuxR C-terminal-related transcriptional regulator [Leucobacter komagatae]TQL43498.1 regulatory LuxR family protein [Leucobacter komagatae]